MPAAALPRVLGGRNAAIDVFRALTVLVMVTVNDWAGVAGLPAWAGHMPADADAMSFVDGVFPAFLFIVGLSIPFALQQRSDGGANSRALLTQAAARALALIVLGLFMVNAEQAAGPGMPLPMPAWALASYVGAFLIWGSLRAGPPLAWPWRGFGVLLLLGLALVYRDASGQRLQPHWWGILGLIGWAYLLACTVYVLTRGRLPALLAALLLCVLWYALAAPWLGQGGHASHTALVLAGCLGARLLFDATRARVLPVLGLALLLAGAATALRPLFPISKIYATPSWALYSAAACLLLVLLLLALLPGGLQRGAVPQPGPLRQRLLQALEPAAAHPLLAYLIPFVVEASLQLAGWQRPAVLRQGWVGIVTAIVYALVVLQLTRVLAARGVRLRL